MKCRQEVRDGGKCTAAASYRFTWPGRDESYVCERHARQLRAIAAAMGLPLQLAPLYLLEYPFSPAQLRRLADALGELDAAGELAKMPGDPGELRRAVGEGLSLCAGEPEGPRMVALALDAEQAQALALVCLLIAEEIRQGFGLPPGGPG